MAPASNRLLDDIARLIADAAGAAQGVRREVEAVVKSQLERLLNDMEVAHREEVEALRDMAVTAREEADDLGRRIATLESRLEALEARAAEAGLGHGSRPVH